MMLRDHDEMLLHLPGTAEEREWLEENLEVLSVKERIALAAAMAREPPQDMAGAVNCLLSLEWYEVRGHVDSYEVLGGFFCSEQFIPMEQRPFFDKAALGRLYEEHHPGLFIGNCYVEFPEKQPALRYDGLELPDIGSEGWSVRLKLASEAMPEGVWIRLPDCTLLDAQCVLPCVQGLAGQYDKINDLIDDEQELGFLLDEQSSSDFFERFSTVLEFEHCRRLNDAVCIGRDLYNYDLVSVDTFIDQVKQKLDERQWAKCGDAVKNCFNYAAYAAAQAERQGYQVTDDGSYFIRKRDSPELEQQPTGMTMQ